MGLAASQARFLQLTARKTNVEYMGQQINQERLALANQSAGLFEKMLTMDPPVPPSSLDDKYFTQGYMFTDTDEIEKKISWVSMNDSSVPSGALGVEYTNYAAGTPSLLDGTIDWSNAAGTSTVAAPGSTNGAVMTTETLDLTSLISTFTDNEDPSGTDAELLAFMGTMGISEQDNTSRSVMRYVTVEHDIYDPDGNYTQIQRNAPAILEFDNLERLINITFMDDVSGSLGSNAGAPPTMTETPGAAPLDPSDSYTYIDASGASNTTAPTALTDFSGYAGTDDSVGLGEELTYSGVFDEDAFNNDMNKYEFNKSAYDYQIERINLQTAKIQKQDKSLELKMKQLDTEHRAIQTELDAVQKVIQKNIEQSFKTFA